MKKIVIPDRKEVVALDPGEKTFLAYYSVNEYGKLGDNMRVSYIKFSIKDQKINICNSKINKFKREEVKK